MRPLFMADEKDLALRSEQRVYMLGDDLMIIPRWATAPTLPSGDWDIIPFEAEDDHYQAFVAQRPGSIVPVANLYQNTVDYQTDSLTLYVNPLNGEAKGSMYEDAKDGFAYRSGDYAEYEFTATVGAKNTLTVTVRQTAGKADYGQKTIRIAVVGDKGKVSYSPWVSGTSVSMKLPKEKVLYLDADKLEFSDIDISAQPSLQEKLAHQVRKMEEAGQAFEW